MGKKKKGGHAGGHGWFVTFADLMALLMSFFVMLVAFSTQDQKKLQIVAGSMKDAFGVQKTSRYSGIVEVDGVPVRPNLKNVAMVPPTEATDHTAPRISHKRSDGKIASLFSRNYALAAVSLRQALQDMPEIAEVSRNILVEETPAGLEIQLLDQDGRSMFPEGSKTPYERTRQVLVAIVPTLKKLPNRIAITGHTNASKGGQFSHMNIWDLTAARAGAVRDILAEEGLPHDRFHSVSGMADTEPLFPDDPFLSANRRVNILLINEAPPIPIGITP
jgi:chemotaxis protein MotB